MSPEEHYRRLEAIYHIAPCNELYAPTLTVGEGRAELRFHIRRQHLHTAGSAHGSVYFKALDDAAFFSANSLVDDVFLLTSHFSLFLLAPATEGTELVSRGRVVHRAKNHFIAEAELFDQDERALARGSGTFVRSSLTLDTPRGHDV